MARALSKVKMESSFEDADQMTNIEVEALNSHKAEFVATVDPLSLANNLHRHGRLSTAVLATLGEMFEVDEDRTTLLEFLINQLPLSTNIFGLVQSLDECGYMSVGARIFLTFLRLNIGVPSHVHKTSSGQRAGVHAYFRRLKIMVHDAQFNNPRQALRNLAERVEYSLSTETDPAKKQILADKCIAIIGAEIDAIAITFDDKLFEHDVFSRLKGLIPHTSNTLITDVVYYGRLANANSIAGNFGDSEILLVAARSRAYHTGPCLELVNMLYIEVYVKLWQYEKTPSLELRKSLLMWGRIGLESLEQEAPDTKSLWRRMFILRMVFCLLGLGNRANRIRDCRVDEACLAEASSLLADIDRHWQGIERRREMFYWVAKARLCEWRDRIPECLQYLKKSRRLALEGHFEEVTFITEYINDFMLPEPLTVPEDVSPATRPNTNVTRDHGTGDGQELNLDLQEAFSDCHSERNESEAPFSNIHFGSIKSNISHQGDIGLCLMEQLKIHDADPRASKMRTFISVGDEINYVHEQSGEQEDEGETALKEVHTRTENEQTINSPEKRAINHTQESSIIPKAVYQRDVEARALHCGAGDLESTSGVAMNHVIANDLLGLRDDPALRLASDALYGEREEPSGCSDPGGGGDSVGSEQLFGDG